MSFDIGQRVKVIRCAGMPSLIGKEGPVVRGLVGDIGVGDPGTVHVDIGGDFEDVRFFFWHELEAIAAAMTEEEQA
jgi:hypothetical protein